LLAGAVKLTVACPPLSVTEPITGALATVTVGVTLLDDVEAGPMPATLEALTTNVYCVPFVKPSTVMGEPVPLAVRLPGVEVTV